MQHNSLGAHPPLSPALPGEIRGTLPARLPGHLSANWCPTSGKHTGPAAGIPPRRGFEQGFSSRESGHFRICRKEFGLCLNPWHKVAALAGLTAVVCGAGHQPGGAAVGTAIGLDALVCGGQRAVDPALARAIGSAGERLVHTEEVTGSIPVSPTKPEPMSIFGRDHIGEPFQ
jgi:hypothetical protein